MLLVNNPGSWRDIYAPLKHAEWHGWTPTDAIFPFFLWIVGVAMTFSLSRRLAAGDDRRRLFGHLVRRSAILFALGLLLASFPFGLLPAHEFALASLRIPGVLQRIGLCYLAAGAIFLWTGWRGQALWAVGLLAGYWLLLALVPVPGYGAGVLAPTGNLAWWIDSHLLAGHTWRGAPVAGFDPEGLLSTLPAIASTLLGVLAGRLLQDQAASPTARTVRLAAGGVGLLAAGALMDRWLPINKNLWTSSYAVFMAGLAMVALAGFYWVIDMRGWRRWATPFVMYGMNAIVLFVLAGLVGRLLTLVRWTGADGKPVVLKTWIYQTWFAPLASPVNASLLFALAFVAVFLGVAWLLWRRKWFVKI